MTRLKLPWLRGLGVASVVSLLASSCIYDSNNRCGPSQHLSANSTCTCDDGLVFSGQDCVPCGDNEQWASGVCVCADGYLRDDSNACVMSSAGVACDPEAEANSCTQKPFTTCRERHTGVGYCTQECAADTDCPHGFSCDTTVSPGTCKTFATGQGDACKTTDDCKGKDANYCENTVVHVCIVVGCDPKSALSCSEGFSCCDVHSLGLALTLCIPEGKCPTMQ